MPNKPIVASDSAICLVGGAVIAKGQISAISPQVTAFVAVDGGADHLLQGGVTPAAVIGDLDSLSDRARATFGAVTCEVTEQSTTDFEKALTRVSAPVLLALGFTGGRLDHALSVLNVMSRYYDRAVILVDDKDVSFVAPFPLCVFAVSEATRVSIMPLAEVKVSVTGLRWPFTDAHMSPAGFTSPSNAALGGQVTIASDGPVLVTLPREHLQIALQAAVRAE